jgi:TatD DNase family protein
MRDATQETYDILRQYAPLKGVMHCYSGSLEMLPKFLDLGLYIGLDGPVTFKNARVPKEVAKAVPLDRLLLETDAPYLAPHPYRGKTNQPAYLDLIAEEIARLRDTSKATIMRATTHNAQALFNV